MAHEADGRWQSCDNGAPVCLLADGLANRYRFSASADDIVQLGVRPSNRRVSHITSCCAPTKSVAALGDVRDTLPPRTRRPQTLIEPRPLRRFVRDGPH